jgi:serine O-acetyltransferase
MPDWSREKPRGLWDPERRLIRSVRGYQRWKARGGLLGSSVARMWVLPYRFWSVVTGASIPLGVRAGGGLVLLHGHGIVLHPRVELGPNCLICQQVTIGVNMSPRAPRVGGHVDFGPGAKVLGDLEIGDHARIGANAVVLQDVPSRATAVGVPARIVQPRTSKARVATLAAS